MIELEVICYDEMNDEIVIVGARIRESTVDFVFAEWQAGGVGHRALRKLVVLGDL